MPCPALGGIAAGCGPNPGGLKPFLYVALKEDVETIPAPTTDTYNIATAVTMVTDKLPVKWELDIDPGKLDIDTEGEGLSVSVSTKMEVFIPRLTAEIAKEVDAALGRELILWTTDKNGKTRIIGDLEQGAFAAYKSSSGDKPASKNGTTITLTLGGQTHAPYFYNAAIPTA